MTFPTYSPGDQAPSAWANAVGDFLDSVFSATPTGSVASSTLTQLSGFVGIYDPLGIVDNPTAGFFAIPTGQLWVIVANLFVESTSTGITRQILQIDDNASRVFRQENARDTSLVFAMGQTAVVEGGAASYQVQAFDAGAGGLIDASSSKISGFRIL